MMHPSRKLALFSALALSSPLLAQDPPKASRLQEILDGADFGDIAAQESADQVTAAVGGALGIFPQGQMTPPFDSAVFAAPVGEVTGPVKSSFGYHIIEVLDRWAQDSAQARHILIPVARTDDSEIELLTMADSLEDLGEAMGGAARGIIVTDDALEAIAPAQVVLVRHVEVTDEGRVICLLPIDHWCGFDDIGRREARRNG